MTFPPLLVGRKIKLCNRIVYAHAKKTIVIRTTAILIKLHKKINQMQNPVFFP